MVKNRDEEKFQGEIVAWDEKGRPVVPDRPVIAFIEGDGTGPDLWAAARPVFDTAVDAAYGGTRSITWKEVYAGEKAQQIYGTDCPLPEETLEAIRRFGIGIKGPLTTPVGRGFRSLNVSLRQRLELYACVRPVRHLSGVPAPVLRPELLNVVIFRENTEDVYAGVEWPAGSGQARELLEHINSILTQEGVQGLSFECALGIKPMSEKNSRRLVRMAIQYALDYGYGSVTLVHKGNIMKYTEGAFKDWGYKTAMEEFPGKTITEAEAWGSYGDKPAEGLVIIKDRIADAMFQQLLLRPHEYGVIATPNLNGDYLSDAAAAQVGGLGLAPGANIGEECALFEATHGTAPKYAGLDKVNPSSLILSGAEMLRFMGWAEAAELILRGLCEAIEKKTVTYDLARQLEGATEVKCSSFSVAVREAITRSALPG